MKIPSFVKLKDNTEYEVIYVDKFKERQVIGECRFPPNSKQIVLKKSLSGELLTSVFIHELMHAISEEYKVGLTEKQVLRLEKGLMQVLKLNRMVRIK